jgi:hypothetical protein
VLMTSVMYLESALRITTELEKGGASVSDRALFIAQIAKALESTHAEVTRLGNNLPNGEIDGLRLLEERSRLLKPQPSIIQTALMNSFPRLNNVPGKGNGFNGLAALPSKTDLLAAACPIDPEFSDPRKEPIVHYSQQPPIHH